MKDKRYGSDSAYTKDVEQKLGRPSVFKICDVREHFDIEMSGANFGDEACIYQLLPHRLASVHG